MGTTSVVWLVSGTEILLNFYKMVQELFSEICLPNLGLAKIDIEPAILYIVIYRSSFVISTFINQLVWNYLLTFST